MDLPRAGMQIFDLIAVVLGPYASQMLADHGTDNQGAGRLRRTHYM
jgi:crotonobetainyl-CoA:carnitine CoA-transferase CaiB-like acyl-CoA transferase